MSVVEHAHVADADDVLITRVRGGDLDAYGALFARHRDAALRLARSLSNGPDADDLVSDAFAKVLATLQKGGGPDLAFRAYLLTAVRRLHVDRIRSQARATPTDDIAALDQGEPFNDTAVSAFENGAAARAFKSLPERWQMVLWHLEVERQKPADIAPLLGMSPNAVAALAYRAREGLRQAFVTMHASDGAHAAGGAEIVDEHCREVREQLGSYIRQGLSRRDSAKVEEHLKGCRPCTAVYLELTEVNSSLAAVLGPVVLGTAAAAYLGGLGAATAGGGGAMAGVGFVIGRVRDFVAANTATVAVGTAATVAVATGAGAYAAHKMHHDAPSAAPPAASAPVHPTSPAPTHAAAPVHPKKSPAAEPTAAATTAIASDVATSAAPSPTSEPSPDSGDSPSDSPSESSSTEPSQGPTSTAPVLHPLALTAPTSAEHTVTLRVTGFASGEGGVVTLHLPLSLPWWHTPSCSGHGHTRTCAVSAADPTVSVRFRGLVNRTFSASFRPASGVDDTSSGDDDVRVTMRGLLPIDVPVGERGVRARK
ncbi:MAG TPA: sigma-70 family RNA polymerase sigma factor [Marmoricola sp.]